MCKYASFVLTKDKVFWSKKSESHEEIIRKFQLCETDSTKSRINILRVELSPTKVWGDLSKWQYKVDQDVLPEWHDPEESERRTRKALAEKIDKKLLKNFKLLDSFLAEINIVKWFKQHGKPLKKWKIFYGKDWAAAGAAARAAAWDAARAAAGDVAWDAARAAARAAACKAQYAVCTGLKIDPKHIKHIEDRWEVWKRGYGLLCDVNGVLYVYGVK
jgi:hypothetical protein